MLLGISLGVASENFANLPALISPWPFVQNACMVSLQGKQRYMGNEAEAIAKSNYKNTPLNIKHLLGRQFKEPEVCGPGNTRCTCPTFVY